MLAWAWAVVAWHEGDVTSVDGAVWLIRIVLVLAALGALFALDDPSIDVTKALVSTRRVLLPVRLLVVAGVVAVGLLPAAALMGGWVDDPATVGGLAVEIVTLLTFLVASALVMQRQFAVAEPAQYLALVVLGLFFLTQLIGQRWPLLIGPGPEWADAHRRWVAVGVASLMVIAWQLRDPASAPLRRWLHR